MYFSEPSVSPKKIQKTKSLTRLSSYLNVSTNEMNSIRDTQSSRKYLLEENLDFR